MGRFNDRKYGIRGFITKFNNIKTRSRIKYLIKTGTYRLPLDKPLQKASKQETVMTNKVFLARTWSCCVITCCRYVNDPH